MLVSSPDLCTVRLFQNRPDATVGEAAETQQALVTVRSNIALGPLPLVHSGSFNKEAFFGLPEA